MSKENNMKRNPSKEFHESRLAHLKRMRPINSINTGRIAEEEYLLNRYSPYTTNPIENPVVLIEAPDKASAERMVNYNKAREILSKRGRGGKPILDKIVELRKPTFVKSRNKIERIDGLYMVTYHKKINLNNPSEDWHLKRRHELDEELKYTYADNDRKEKKIQIAEQQLCIDEPSLSHIFHRNPRTQLPPIIKKRGVAPKLSIAKLAEYNNVVILAVKNAQLVGKGRVVTYGDFTVSNYAPNMYYVINKKKKKTYKVIVTGDDIYSVAKVKITKPSRDHTRAPLAVGERRVGKKGRGRPRKHNPIQNPRPPKGFLTKWRSKLRKQYPKRWNESATHYKNKLNTIAAGIWWKMPQSTRDNLVRKYDK